MVQAVRAGYLRCYGWGAIALGGVVASSDKGDTHLAR